MNTAVLLTISISFAVVNNLLLHDSKNKGFRGIGDVLLFNAMVSAIWIIGLSALNKGVDISASAWIWGGIYGSVMSAFLLCKMQALATGPVSLTSFIGCSSLLLSTGFGIIYFHEHISVIQVIGVAFLLIALFLTIFKTTGGAPIDGKPGKTWPIWSSLFFVCSAATGIIFKLHQFSSARNEVNRMMLAAAVTSTVLFLISSLIVQFGTDKTMPRIAPAAWVSVIVCGIVSCGYNRLNISLSGMLPSVIFFPVFNGSVILFASLLAALLFREKITKRQMIGMGIGIFSLMMVSGVFGY